MQCKVVVLDRGFGASIRALAAEGAAVWVVNSVENRKWCEIVWNDDKHGLFKAPISLTCFDPDGYADDLQLLFAFVPEVLEHNPLVRCITVVGYRSNARPIDEIRSLGFQVEKRDDQTFLLRPLPGDDQDTAAT